MEFSIIKKDPLINEIDPLFTNALTVFLLAQASFALYFQLMLYF